MKPLRVTLLYSHQPTGHSLAASAVEQALLARQPDAEIQRAALSGELYPRLGPAIAKTYHSVATSLPSIWEHLYDNAAVAGAAEFLLAPLRRREGARLRALLNRTKPDVVIATQALPCNILAAEKREGRLSVPLIAVLTDFVAHRYWIARGVDLYCAPSEATAADLVRHGVPASRVRVTGIPIAPGFARAPERAEARRALGLDPDLPVLLVTGGTKGLGGMEAAVAAIAGGASRPQLLVSCGSNAGLYARLSRRALPGVRLSRGLEAQMPTMLAAADLLVGKPGGLTTAEALAMGLPMAVYAPLPGQERHNARYLERHGAAVLSETPRRLAADVARLLAEPASLALLSVAARALGRPDSAAAIADAALEAAGAPLTRA